MSDDPLRALHPGLSPFSSLSPHSKPSITERPLIQRTDLCPCDGYCPKCRIPQTKLTVGEPGDKYEEEADQVADQVMRMPVDHLQFQPIEEEEEEMQMKSDEGAVGTSTAVAQGVVAQRHGGKPLSQNLLNFFEPRFGHGFGGVRIYHDDRATETADTLNARAFTI